MKQNMISVILPTYNESENIRAIVPEIFSVLKNSSLEGELIIVDDNSPDKTAVVAMEFVKSHPLKVHVRENERGLATAVMKGFEIASGDIYVVMDADLSHPAGKIPEMVEPIIKGRCNLTVGSRYAGAAAGVKWSFMRMVMSRFAGLLARGLTTLSDPTSGFMAVRKDALKGVELDPVGWKIALEIVVKTGERYQEIPIIFSDRLKGKSKLDTKIKAQYIAHLWKLYRYKYKQRFMNRSSVR